MHPTEPIPQPTNQPEPPKALPTHIATFLNLVRTLLGYAKHLDQTLTKQAVHPRFPTLAIGFGTHDFRRIAAHIQRGILRAMMLERFLLARAAQGRDIDPTPPAEPAEPADIEALDIKLRTPVENPTPRPKPERRLSTDPDDPLNFSMPTLKELEAQIRRRSIGRTIADICLDLGIGPSICDGAFWQDIYDALWHFGGSFEQLCGTQTKRQEAFQLERDQRPDTWTWEIWDRPKEAIRQMLGCLLGEPPPAALA